MPAIHIAVHPLPRTVEELHERLDNVRFFANKALDFAKQRIKTGIKCYLKHIICFFF